MRDAVGILQSAEIPFVLGGGLSAWARGGPRSEHDVDFLVRPEDVDTALDAFEAAGWETERPPEGWLVKTWHPNGALVDLIYNPASGPVTDELIERATARRGDGGARPRLDARGRDGREAHGADRAGAGLRPRPRVGARAPRADRLGRGAGANRGVAVRARLLHARRGARRRRAGRASRALRRRAPKLVPRLRPSGAWRARDRRVCRLRRPIRIGADVAGVDQLRDDALGARSLMPTRSATSRSRDARAPASRVTLGVVGDARAGLAVASVLDSGLASYAANAYWISRFGSRCVLSKRRRDASWSSNEPARRDVTESQRAALAADGRGRPTAASTLCRRRASTLLPRRVTADRVRRAPQSIGRPHPSTRRYMTGASVTRRSRRAQKKKLDQALHQSSAADDERARAGDLDVLAVPVLLQAVGRRELDRDLARAAGVVRRDGGEIGQRLASRPPRSARAPRCGVFIRALKRPRPSFTSTVVSPSPSSSRRLAAHGAVARDEHDRRRPSGRRAPR